jgi:putative lipoprotein
MPPTACPENHLRPINSLLCAVALLAACTHGSHQGEGRQLVPAPAQGPPRTFVYECNDGYSFIARLEGEKAWLFLPEQTSSLPQVPAGSGAKYSDGLLTFWNKGDKALFESGKVTHRDCMNNPSRAIWEDAKLRGADFRAVGNEPGWHLEIKAGEKVVFVGDYGQTRYEFATPEPLNDQTARKTTYQVQNAEHELTIVLEALLCHDSMSGEPFETTVTAILDGRTYRGCGRPLH